VEELNLNHMAGEQYQNWAPGASSARPMPAGGLGFSGKMDNVCRRKATHT
jgi:hypothetical protein